MVRMKNDMAAPPQSWARSARWPTLSLPIRVTVLAAVAENMPSGAAQRPG
jgi:leucyl aminopeptidase